MFRLLVCLCVAYHTLSSIDEKELSSRRFLSQLRLNEAEPGIAEKRAGTSSGSADASASLSTMSEYNLPADISVGDGETQRFEDTSNLLAQALTRVQAREQQAALNALAAATNRLGGRKYGPTHPAARALELINAAIDAAIVDTERKRDSAAFAIRQSMQMLLAAREHELADDGGLIADGGRVVQACPHCDVADLQRRIDLERARALWYCNSCFTPVEEPNERTPHQTKPSRLLEQADPRAIGGDD